MARLVVIATIALSLFGFYRLMGYDQQTWQFLAIIEMIIGNGNPRGPVQSSEYAALVFFLAIGFFFEANPTSGLTSTMIISETEKSIQSFEDLRKNNITVLLSNHPYKTNTSIYKQIVDLKIKYKSFDFYTNLTTPES